MAGESEPNQDGPNDDGPNEDVPDEDADSAIGGDSRPVSTFTLDSDVCRFIEEHDRTYHAYKSGKYLLPNDDEEIARLNVLHEAIKCLLPDLFVSPLENLMSALDVGCGTGRWCIDLADKFPGCEVTGFDLSPIQPNWIPPNSKFRVFDLEDKEWGFGPVFNLVHTRCLHGVAIRSLPHFLCQARESLTPGGWLEMQEFSYRFESDDNTIPVDSVLRLWEDVWHSAFNQIGLGGSSDCRVLQSAMREAGFCNIATRCVKVPIGSWPKDESYKTAGKYCLAQLMMGGLRGMSVKPLKDVKRYTEQQFESLMDKCLQELGKKGLHAYWPLYITYGQKPHVENTSILAVRGRTAE